MQSGRMQFTPTGGWLGPPLYPLPGGEGREPLQFAPPHLDSALSYVGTVEVGADNHGPEVKRFLASVGLDEGYAWCAAFVSFCLEVVDGKKEEVKSEKGKPTPLSSPEEGKENDLRIVWPTIRSARAQAFITERSIKASSVLMGTEEAEIGSVVIWKKGNGIYGHAGFTVSEADSELCFETIEGNTGPGTNVTLSVEEERNGDGVYQRYRCIQPANYFRIVSFTPVIYRGKNPPLYPLPGGE